MEVGRERGDSLRGATEHEEAANAEIERVGDERGEMGEAVNWVPSKGGDDETRRVAHAGV